MNDQDYIRKAAELADGWSIDELGLVRAGFGMTMPLSGLKQGYKDALAAQLVRQVDALIGYEVVSMSDEVYVWHNDRRGIPQTDAYVNDTDRTMNTIKAIVDSEVQK